MCIGYTHTYTYPILINNQFLHREFILIKRNCIDTRACARTHTKALNFIILFLESLLGSFSSSYTTCERISHFLYIHHNTSNTSDPAHISDTRFTLCVLLILYMKIVDAVFDKIQHKLVLICLQKNRKETLKGKLFRRK